MIDTYRRLIISVDWVTVIKISSSKWRLDLCKCNWLWLQVYGLQNDKQHHIYHHWCRMTRSPWYKFDCQSHGYRNFECYCNFAATQFPVLSHFARNCLSNLAPNGVKPSAGTCFIQLFWLSVISVSLHWHHNENDGVPNHRRFDCMLSRLFRRRSKKTSKFRVTGLCEGIPHTKSQ